MTENPIITTVIYPDYDGSTTYPYGTKKANKTFSVLVADEHLDKTLDMRNTNMLPPVTTQQAMNDKREMKMNTAMTVYVGCLSIIGLYLIFKLTNN